jgi:Cu+-exporting ATPase
MFYLVLKTSIIENYNSKNEKNYTIMKKLIYLISVLALVSCQSGNKIKPEEKTAPESVQVVETTINIRGMHCENCVASVEKGVKELDGIVSVTVSLNDSNAVVSYDKSKVELAKIEEAIEKRGYTVKAGM